jgi:hypothetical protein
MCLADLTSVVAQTGSLPYRRFAIGGAPASSNMFDLADSPQDAIMRYGGAPLCATQKRFTGALATKLPVLSGSFQSERTK